ncbi:hypothetical protein DL770_003597 [Monosporascus sp. CRB-9-2]|nr:hypothetical protein DL770_003597 [Monosporascus sp. CRB-9-2]
MESLEDPLRLIREQIAHMEGTNKIFRRFDSKVRTDAKERVRDLEEQNGRFPPLPPRLPRPEYALTANLLDQDEDSLKFYLACERGIMPDVISFVEGNNHLPKQAVRQYGLEQASFGRKPEVARYLLKNGTLLHSNCFMRSVGINLSGATVEDISIFDKADCGGDEDSLISLLQAFIEVGSWHPNQPWESPTMRLPHVAICTPRARTDSMILKFLLAHGADPNLGKFDKGTNVPGVTLSVNRQSPAMLNYAVAKSDLSMVDLLLRYGARPDCEGLHLLHSIAQSFDHGDFTVRRRPLAEYLLNHGLANVNEVKPMPWRHEGTKLHMGGYTETETPLTRACAASDWEFVEWLLEHGADPDALDGKAYKEQWWCKPYFGPNDPSQLTKLINKVQEKKRSKDRLS